MIAARHTPGPWEQKIQSCALWSICTVYGTDQGWVEIHAPNGSQNADFRAESTANARLIAAAPDLLETATKALEALTAVHIHGDVACVVAPDGEIYLRPVIDALRQVIAKATGEIK